MGKQWYAVHTYSGHENKVKEAIERKVANLGFSEQFGEIRIPVVDEAYIAKGGKKKVRSRKVLPGYVLISMELEDKTWSVVKSTPGVTGFVGAKGDGVPTALTNEEVEDFLNVEEKKTKERMPTEIDYEVGEHVRVIDGPFNTFSGVVEEIFPDKGRLRVKVEIFGRGTPVELEITQVGKL